MWRPHRRSSASGNTVGMSEVSIRELRNHGGEVVDRAARGEQITITRSGRAVAELRAISPAPVSAASLLERWRGLPLVDPATPAQRRRSASRLQPVNAEARMARGALDTSTVILLARLADATTLPAEPLITAAPSPSCRSVRSSQRIARRGPRARLTSNAPRQTLHRSLSMRCCSCVWPRRCLPAPVRA